VRLARNVTSRKVGPSPRGDPSEEVKKGGRDSYEVSAEEKGKGGKPLLVRLWNPAKRKKKLGGFFRKS